MMNLSQTKLVGLTMELDLKTREYKNLCNKLNKLKEKQIDPNDERLFDVKELFQKNHDDIVKINRQINEIKEKQKYDRQETEEEKTQKYNPDDIFKERQNKVEEQETINVENYSENLPIEKKESFYKKIINFFRNLFHLN